MITKQNLLIISAYSAIYLRSTKVIELKSKIKSFCGLPADYDCEFYVSGPGGTRIVLTDEVCNSFLIYIIIIYFI